MSPIIEQQHQGPVYTYDVKQSDVRLGRGRDCAACIGTIAFKALLESRIGSYTNSKSTYGDKIHLCTEVVETVHEAGGRFVLKSRAQGDSTLWEVLDRKTAQTKIRECFRDCVKRSNPSLLLVKAGMSRKFNAQQSYAEILVQVEKCPKVHRFLQSQRSNKKRSSTHSSSSPNAVVSSLHKSLWPSLGMGKEKLPSFSSPDLLKAEWRPTKAVHTRDFTPPLIDVPSPVTSRETVDLTGSLVKKTSSPDPSSTFLDGMMFVWSNLESLDDFLGNKGAPPASQTRKSNTESTPPPRTDGWMTAMCRNSSNQGIQKPFLSTTPTAPVLPVLPVPVEEDEGAQDCSSEPSTEEILELINPQGSDLVIGDDSMSCFSLCTTEDLSEGWTNSWDDVGQVDDISLKSCENWMSSAMKVQMEFQTTAN